MSLYQTNAIILKSRNFGEADRVLVMLSEEHGKMEAVVKGARRQRSRFVGNTLPFNYLKTLLLTGKNLDTLSQAELIHPFSSLREDLTRLAYASFWVELVDAFLPEREEAREIFRFLLAAFIVLEKAADPELVSLAFQIRLLNYLGYQPQLDQCVGCGLSEATYTFSAAGGGLVCPACGVQYRDLINISQEAVTNFHKFIACDLRELTSLAVSTQTRQLMRQVLRTFVEARLDRPIKSQVFLDNLLP